MHQLQMFKHQIADIKEADDANDVDGLEGEEAKHKSPEFMFPRTFKGDNGRE